MGHLDQYAVLTRGKTIRDILRSAFQGMFDLEAEMLALYEKMGEAEPDEVEKMMLDVGEIQDLLDHSSFYTIDAKIEEVAREWPWAWQYWFRQGCC